MKRIFVAFYILLISSSSVFSEKIDYNSMFVQKLDSVNFYINSDILKSKTFLSDLSEIAINSKDDNLLAHYYFYEAMLLQLQNNMLGALNSYFKSLKHTELSGNSILNGALYNNIASCYNTLKDYDNSIYYFKKSIQLYEQKEDFSNMASLYNNLGMSYSYKLKLDSAILFLQKSLSYLDKNKEQESYYATKSNLAEVYFLKGEKNKAFEIYNTAIPVFIDKNSKYNLALSYNRLSDYYKNNYDSCLYYAEKSLNITSNMDAFVLKKKSLSNIIEAKKFFHKTDSLSVVQGELIELITENERTNNKKALAEIKTKYKVKEKDETIDNQSHKIQNQQNIIWMMIFVISLIIIILVILYLFYIKTKQKNRILIDQNIENTNKNIEIRDLRNKLSNNPNTASANYNGLTIEDLLMYMDKEKPHLRTDLSINTLSDMLNVEYYTLSNLINNEAQMSYSSFINKYRIDEAKELILNPDNNSLTLEHLATKAGFNSVTSFNRVFKSLTGLTPSFYRKSVS